MASTYLPVISERGYEFFASNHKGDIAKAYIAHSPDLAKANDTFWRRGYPLQLRKRLLATYGHYVNDQSMDNVPFSDYNYKFDWKEQLLNTDDVTLEDIISGKFPSSVLAWDVPPPATATTNTDHVASWKGGVPPYEATIKGPVDLNNETVAVPPLNIDMNVDGTNQPVGKYTWKVTDAAGTSITADTTVS